MNAGINARTLRLVAPITTSIIICVSFLLSGISTVFADTVNYFYDDLGRLSRVTRGTSGVVYNYDELGNILSVTASTAANASPVINSISPNVLLVGRTMIVTISGNNLLTTDNVTSNGGLVTINSVTATDTKITAEMTAISAGTDTIKVTTRNGSPNYAQTGVTLISSILAFSPSQLALVPGGSGTLTASITPPLASPLVINLDSSNTSVATVPQSITIPTSGSQNFTVNAWQAGITTISSGGLGTLVLVESPFTGDVNGLVANRISVIIDSPTGNSTNIVNAVSVSIDSPTGNSINTANAVSVSIDASTDNSITAANPVSVKIQ